MSLGTRIFLAIVGTLMAVVMFLDGATGEQSNAWSSYAFAVFCLFIAGGAVLRGRAAKFCGSVIGACVFIAGLAYVGHELAAGPALSGDQSGPSIINACKFLLFFGGPGLFFAIRWRFGFSKSDSSPQAPVVDGKSKQG